METKERHHVTIKPSVWEIISEGAYTMRMSRSEYIEWLATQRELEKQEPPFSNTMPDAS